MPNFFQLLLQMHIPFFDLPFSMFNFSYVIGGIGTASLRQTSVDGILHAVEGFGPCSEESVTNSR